MVERAPPHERRGGDFDLAPRDQGIGPLKVQHVVERIVEGPQVGIDLRDHVAGEVSELLARLHGGPRQDDPVHLAPAQAGHRDRKSTRLNSSHGYISYAVFCLKKKKTKRSIPATADIA